MNVYTTEKPKQATISAVVTRADGRVEDFGVIAYYNRNKLKNWWWHIRYFFRSRI